MSSLREIEREYVNDDAKPFKKYHAEQIKLISNPDCIDLDRLDYEVVIEPIQSVLKDNPYMEYARLELITWAVLANIDKLKYKLKR